MKNGGAIAGFLIGTSVVLLVMTLYEGINESVRGAFLCVGAVTLIATLTATYGRTRA